MNQMAREENLNLPRILCLHGGGVNAEVFRLQARAIIFALKDRFRFVFADGPFFCEAGPGILPVYEDFGPYRRWVRWLPEHQQIDAGTARDEIWWQLHEAMDSDTRIGARGKFVGLLGFSQGAKISASLLFEQQFRNELQDRASLQESDMKKPDFRFAILLAGRAPLISLRAETDNINGIASPAEICEGGAQVNESTSDHILQLPTIHVHGLRDAGLSLHRELLNRYCEASSAQVIEWDGDHRVPFKSSDVTLITQAIENLTWE